MREQHLFHYLELLLLILCTFGDFIYNTRKDCWLFIVLSIHQKVKNISSKKRGWLILGKMQFIGLQLLERELLKIRESCSSKITSFVAIVQMSQKFLSLKCYCVERKRRYLDGYKYYGCLCWRFNFGFHKTLSQKYRTNFQDIFIAKHQPWEKEKLIGFQYEKG